MFIQEFDGVHNHFLILENSLVPPCNNWYIYNTKLINDSVLLSIMSLIT